MSNADKWLEQLDQALERHRDDDPPRLEVSVPLDRLLHRGHCEALLSDLRKFGSAGWESVLATKSAWQKLPAEPGLYMFVWSPLFRLPRHDSDGDRRIDYLLYVGRTGTGKSDGSLRARYKSGYSGLVGGDPERLWSREPLKNRDDRLSRYLSLRPLWFWYLVLDPNAPIEDLERRLFNLYSPPLNFSGGPRLRPVGRKPAF